MQPYKGYFIEGSALLVHPFSPDWYVWRQHFGFGSFKHNRGNHALFSVAPAVHREHQRTCGVVSSWRFADRGGRMPPASATEFNGSVA